jgi:hypothetical protein
MPVIRALFVLLVLAVPAAAGEVPRARPRALAIVRAGIPLPKPRPPLPDFLLQSVMLPNPLPATALPATALPASAPPAGEAEQPVAPPQPSACQLRLGEVAVIAPLPPLIGPGECGAVDVVRLEGVLLADKSRVALNPPATLRCAMAEAVASWVREDMVALAGGLGAPLTGIENYDSYDCRGRNRIVGAKTSEHGKANALDIRALRLANGRLVEPTDPAVAHEFRDALRQSACARFMTVLGPGSDGYHESHIHVDLAERRGNYRTCHWEVRDPAPEAAAVPLPRPRPVLATDEAPDEPPDEP